MQDPACLSQYASRDTHWDHARHIQHAYGYHDFSDPREAFRLVRWLYSRAWLSAERPSVLFDLATARLVERKVLLPGVTTLKPGSATKPFPGIEAAVYDDQGNDIPAGGGGGYLVIRRPYPAMLRGFHKDPDRYVQTYWSRFPGVYFAGDGAKRDEEGDFWLMGRIDDVMNVAGHRLSTIEIESALVDGCKGIR